MEDINPIITFENIKNRYLSFILTTICRNNILLYNELKSFYSNNNILWTDLFLQETPQYKKINSEEEINKAGFNVSTSKLISHFIKKGMNPYIHQVEAWNAINKGKNCIISTGTGSGKTEAFLFPIINKLSDNPEKNIQVIIIYPLKALATDQGRRIGNTIDIFNELSGLNLKFAILDGDTKKSSQDKSKRRSPLGFSSEIVTEEEMIESPPNILITNYAMLERILLDPKHSKIMNNCNLKYVILDEIHYYRGAQGIDVALLMRRLQFHLSRKQKSKPQYIGTSATISNLSDSSKEVTDFLFKLFNQKFSDSDIIRPTYSQEYFRSPLFKPMPYNLSMKDNFKGNIKAHSFFCSPNPLYRCHNCREIYTKHEGTCVRCKSKLIFEILTCRQCGKEYFNYPFEDINSHTDLSIECFDLIKSISMFKEGSNTKKGGDLVLLNDKSSEKMLKLKICNLCLSLFSNDNTCCPNCFNKDTYEVSIVKDEEKNVDLKKESNDKYCPECKFRESRQSVIVPISKISDENCSHIIFDELFMNLPEGNRKLLVFTDNVQRTSKFAREIEETHIKNIARANLHNKIETLNEEIGVDDIIHIIMKEVNSSTDLSEYLEANIKKELYGEILSKGRKVASLANRGVFFLDIKNINRFEEGDRENIAKAFEVFQQNQQVLDYYKTLKREEVQDLHNFLDDKSLLEKIHRNINDLWRKKLKNPDLSDAKKILTLLKEKGFIAEYDDKLFFKECFITINKLSKDNSPVPNYYEEWKSIKNIPIIKTKIDTGKTDPEERFETENEFKTNASSVNFLVATPTLELGIDIGDLDVIGLLYAPPSPAQYNQRIGRAGRKGQSSFSITFLSRRSLDSTYFYNPQDLILGEIKPPSFEIDLDIPLKKSLFSLFFYYLLYETNFRKEKYGVGWNNKDNWERDHKALTGYWKEYYPKFNQFISSYLNDFGVKIDLNGLLDEWINKLEDHINIQKSINKSLGYSQDIYNYFQEAGLLPDYAFGRGGTIVLVKYGDPIKGFDLHDVCPPSTLDFKKSRFNCKSLSLKPSHFKVIGNSYKRCLHCRNVMSISKEYNKCPFCNNIMEIENKEIIDPKVINAQRSTFSLNPKSIKWDYYIMNAPKDISMNGLTTYITADIGALYGSVRDNKKDNQYYLCSECHQMYSKDSKKEEGHTHKASKMIIGTKFKTQVAIFDMPKNLLVDDITLLNTLISAITIESGCEDGEVSGFSLGNQSKYVLFDDVEGGVGFVKVLSERFYDVLKTMKKLCEMNCCENGCIRCIGSFWKQNDLDYLNKRNLLPVINELMNKYGNK